MSSSWQGLKSTFWTNPNDNQGKHHEHGLDCAQHPSRFRRSCWSSKCSFLFYLSNSIGHCIISELLIFGKTGFQNQVLGGSNYFCIPGIVARVFSTRRNSGMHSDALSLSLEYVVKDSQHFSFNVKEGKDHVSKSLQFSFLDQVMMRRFSTVTFESLNKIHVLSSIWFDFRMFDWRG